MPVLVEFFDPYMLKNILALHAFKPATAVMVYDRRTATRLQLKQVRDSVRNRRPDFHLVTLDIDHNDMDAVERVCTELRKTYHDTVFDLTGGPELVTVAVGRFCIQTGAPMFHIDAKRGVLRDLQGCAQLKQQFQMPELTIEDFLTAYGAGIQNNNHMTPPEALEPLVMRVWELIAADVKEWKRQCQYIQSAVARMGHNGDDSLFVKAPVSWRERTGQLQAHPDFLKGLEQAGAIRNLGISHGTVSFRFHDHIIKQYLCDFGVWLELYVYLTAKRMRYFHEVRMSINIDWDGDRRDFAQAINEIDVLLVRGITPVFISCKLSVPDSAALNEIRLYAARFGGPSAKAVIVTLADLSGQPAILKRCKELPVTAIDAGDIRAGRAADILKSLAD